MPLLLFILTVIGLIVILGLLALGVKEAYKFYKRVESYNKSKVTSKDSED